MNPILLELLSQGIPYLLALLKKGREEHPELLLLTDAQIIELLQTNSDQIVAKAATWLAAHPVSDATGSGE